MGQFVLDMWEHNNRAEITSQRWSQFDPIRTLELFVCSENTTAQQPEQIALICAAWQQVPKHGLSKKQNMVSYFYVLSTVLALFSRAPLVLMILKTSLLCMCVAFSIWGMC